MQLGETAHLRAHPVRVTAFLNVAEGAQIGARKHFCSCNRLAAPMHKSWRADLGDLGSQWEGQRRSQNPTPPQPHPSEAVPLLTPPTAPQWTTASVIDTGLDRLGLLKNTRWQKVFLKPAFLHPRILVRRGEEGRSSFFKVLLKMTFWGKFTHGKTYPRTMTMWNLLIYLTGLILRSYQTSRSSQLTPPLLSGEKDCHVLGRTSPLRVPNLNTERHWGTNWSPKCHQLKTSRRCPRERATQWFPGQQMAQSCAHSHCLPLSQSQGSRK